MSSSMAQKSSSNRARRARNYAISSEPADLAGPAVCQAIAAGDAQDPLEEGDMRAAAADDQEERAAVGIAA